MNIEDLMNVEVTSVSRHEQSLSRTAIWNTRILPAASIRRSCRAVLTPSWLGIFEPERL
jgi:hypothetical protein